VYNSIFSNSGHVGWCTASPDTILKLDTLVMIQINFGHVSDCILELLWLSTLAMLQTVFWNCCGYLLWPCFRLYFGTVVAIDFAHGSDCILELLWLSTNTICNMGKVDSHNSSKIQSETWAKSIATTFPKYSLKHDQSR
jgi:hypothetical protein